MTMTERTTIFLPIDSVSPDPLQPRTLKTGEEFDAHIENLAASMEARGQDKPIEVRPHPDGTPGKWMIVDGECRYRAHLLSKKLRGAGTIEAFAKEYASDGDVFLSQLSANANSKGLEPMEEIRAFATAMDRGATIEEVSANLGAPVDRIKKDLAILTLPEKVQQAIESGRLAKKTAHYILKRIPDDGTMEDVSAKQVTAMEKAGKCKNAKMAEAAIDTYVQDSAYQRVDMEVDDGTQDKDGTVKKAGKMLDQIVKFDRKWSESPFANGSGKVLAKAANARNAKEIGSLTAYFGLAKRLRAMADHIEKSGMEFCAQSNLTLDGEPIRTGTNG